MDMQVAGIDYVVIVLYLVLIRYTCIPSESQESRATNI